MTASAGRRQPHTGRSADPWRRFAAGLVWTCTRVACWRSRWTPTVVRFAGSGWGDREGGGVPGRSAGPDASRVRGGADWVRARQGAARGGDRVRGGSPGKIERPAQDKVKTDARDAERVLRLLMIDALSRCAFRASRRRRSATSSRAGGRARGSDALTPAAEQAAVASRDRL
jgi:hypothetical protein